jgi:hypothetical protein
MKKIAFALVLGFLFITTNIYAADGDFIVEGDVGIGTDTPIATLDVRGDAVFNENAGDYDFRIKGLSDSHLFFIDADRDNIGIGTDTLNNTLFKMHLITTNVRGLNVSVKTDTNTTGGFMTGANYTSTIDGSTSTDFLRGMDATLQMLSTKTGGSVPGGEGAVFTFQVGRTDTGGTTSVDAVTGLKYTLNRRYNNARTYNITDSYGFKSVIQDGGSAATAINVTNHYHQYLADYTPAGTPKVNITNLYGMYLEKFDSATNNYGIVLDGDGEGSDIAFGADQDAKIYWDGANLKFDTNASGQNGVAWFSGTVDADDYVTHTSIFDKNKRATDYIKDADYYKKADGSIDHTKFYGYVKTKVPDYNNCQDIYEYTEYCYRFELGDLLESFCTKRQLTEEELLSHNLTFAGQYDKYREECALIEADGVSLGKEVDVLRQMVSEMSSELCIYNNKYSWCG